MATWTRALVTGASSGIGEAFARHLAAAGTDLVVVARRRHRLEELAAGLAGDHGVGVEVLDADLTESEALASVERRLRERDRPVDLLVNNAGFGGHGPFIELDVDRQSDQVRIHALAMLRLSHAAIGGMVERGRGGVINVSSMAGLVPLPQWATYSASKAFMTRFSKALHEELRPSGVGVLALQPGFTRTEFHDHTEFRRSSVPGPFWMPAERVVESALDALAAGHSECVPGALYQFLWAASKVTPWAVTSRLARAAARRR